MSRFAKFNELKLNLQSFCLNILEVSDIDVEIIKNKYCENTDFQREISNLLKNKIILLKPMMQKSPNSGAEGLYLQTPSVLIEEHLSWLINSCKDCFLCNSWKNFEIK